MIFQLAFLIYVIIGAITAHDVMHYSPREYDESLAGFMTMVLVLLFIACWPAVWILRVIVGVMRRLR